MTGVIEHTKQMSDITIDMQLMSWMNLLSTTCESGIGTWSGCKVGNMIGAITAIVLYDNFDDEYYTLTWQPESGTEKEMLEKFIDMLRDKDPDMLISWFGWKFDLPNN